jgi:hypothetical protein
LLAVQQQKLERIKADMAKNGRNRGRWAHAGK